MFSFNSKSYSITPYYFVNSHHPDLWKAPASRHSHSHTLPHQEPASVAVEESTEWITNDAQNFMIVDSLVRKTKFFIQKHTGDILNLAGSRELPFFISDALLWHTQRTDAWPRGSGLYKQEVENMHTLTHTATQKASPMAGPDSDLLELLFDVALVMQQLLQQSVASWTRHSFLVSGVCVWKCVHLWCKVPLLTAVTHLFPLNKISG